MIRIKLNSFSDRYFEIDYIENEKLDEILKRACEIHKIDYDLFYSFFKIYINGEEVDSKVWPFIKPKKDAHVDLVLFPKSGSTGRILGQLALAVAVIAVGSVNPYAGAALAIGGGLALNQLFPPPSLDLGASTKKYNQEESQMYTISGQANQVKKYGYVPKVYGEHRIFPNVAATPYTEFEVVDGEIYQFFYAVYDLGYGPMNVKDIRIGDTDIEFFEDAFYRLVDFNKPTVNEGDWDDALSNRLAFYKGDNNVESVGAAINANQNDSGVEFDDYTIIRNADENPDDLEQEIIVDFGFPQGLTTIGTNGENAARSVEFNIQFAEVGTENWFGFNDVNKVTNFSTVGDFVTNQSFGLQFPWRDEWFDVDHATYGPFPGEYYRRLSIEVVPWYEHGKYDAPLTFYQYAALGIDGARVLLIRHGFKKGDTEIVSTTLINPGNYLRHANEIVGRVKTRTEVVSGVYKYTLYSGLPYDIYVFSDLVRQLRTDINDPFTGQYQSYYADGFTSDTPETRNGTLIYEGNTNGVFTVKENKSDAVYASIRFTPKTTNQIKVRVQRVRSFGGYTYRQFDDAVWTNLTTRLDTDPIVTDQRHVFLELKIRATDQLNGSIQNLSAVCTSVLDVYNSSTGEWEKQATSNPAWVYADLLTGPINKRAVSKNRLDTTSLLEWESFCDEVPDAPTGLEVFIKPRFTCNFVQDTNITVASLIQLVTSSAQASINIINGKYGVLIDKDKTVPVQLFTPRNSWNFSSTRTYSNLPDAIKVKYVDPSKQWGVYEQIVYSDGKTLETAENFESIDSFGCTNFEQAWRTGRYFLVSSILRQENISIDVDFEHLICTRGDYVKLQHDVMRVGGTPARVTGVNVDVIEIDDGFVAEVGVSYGYVFRSSTQVYTGTMTVLTSSTAQVDGDVPNEGDLIVWGEVESITIDCLVKSITPKDDLTATLELIEKADEVYTAESTDTIPEYDPELVDDIDDETPPNEVQDLQVIESSNRCGNGDYVYYIQLDWVTPTGGIVEQYEVYVDRGNGYKLVDYTTVSDYEYIVDANYLGFEHSFKILGVSARGQKLNLGNVSSVTETPVVKSTQPSDVDALYINITNESLQLDWDDVEDCDIDYYSIRYSPNTSATWNSSIPLQVVDRNTSLVSVQARVGAYFIKAIDWAGNESANAAIAITSIPSLVNINIIEETNDFPALNGVLEETQKFGNELLLEEQTAATPGVIEYYEEGYYYYDTLLDLGEIYTVRLQSLIEAEGFSIDDLMVNWDTLADVDTLSGASVSDWSVEAQYRATNNYNVMSEWDAMSDIDPISEGVQEDFTEWRKFTVGDFTGRIFQYRLKLESFNPNVTPRVFDGIIKADMPDRVENFNNLTTTSGEYTLTYNPAFKGPGNSPNVQVTIDDAQQGDYYNVVSKTLNGCVVQVFDKDSNPVDRQIDIFVKGYGRKQTEVI